MRVGIGLGAFAIIAVILNLLRLPIDWKIFLVLSLLGPFYGLSILFRKKKLKSIFHLPNKTSLTKSNLTILIVLVLFVLTFFMYHQGAFAYDYFEDDDPWEHAKGIKYVAVEKSLETPELEEGWKFGYLDPYPPAYEALLGVLHQTSPSLNWTMKFFNVLIISLGIFFFFFFAQRFMGDRKKALLATFILAVIPCYLSHFIWAHALVPTLFFVAMYCLEMIRVDKKWLLPGMLTIAALCLTHMLQPIKLGVLFVLYLLIKSLMEKKWLKLETLTVVGGYLLSALWWIFKWNAMWGVKLEGRLGEEGVQAAQSGGTNLISTVLSSLTKVFPPWGGTGTRVYTFSDFFFASSQNMINNPIGFGIVISILLIVALIFIIVKFRKFWKEPTQSWLIVTLAWFVFLFVFVNSMTFHLPLGLEAFRIWMLLAIPVSLLAAEGAMFIANSGKSLKVPATIVLSILILGLVLTSGYQKYTFNTMTWMPGKSWTSFEELNGFTWMKDNLPTDTKVFGFGNPKAVLAVDKFACVWCQDFIDFNKQALEKDPQQLRTWLKANGYEYLVLRGFDVLALEEQYGQETAIKMVNEKVNEIGAQSQYFKMVHQTEGFFLFKVV